MAFADAVLAGPIPGSLLAPFPQADREMIQQEAAANPSFGRLIAQTLSRPNGPQIVTQSARKAIANELNPHMYPESAGQWPVLRRMTEDLAASTVSDVTSKVDRMSFSEKVRAIEGIARNGPPGAAGGMGQLGQTSDIGALGGLASSIVQVASSIYTSHLIATTTKDIAKIQAGVMVHSADVSLEIARAQAAMAEAQASMARERTQQQAIQLQQQQLAIDHPAVAQQPVPDQTATEATVQPTYAAPATSPAATPAQVPQQAPAASSSMVLPVVVGGGAAVLYALLSGAPAGQYMGQFEIERFERLPQSLQNYLAEEAEDPAFVTGYLIPMLRTPDPYYQVLSDLSYETHMMQVHGMGYLGKSFFKKLVKFHKALFRDIPKKVLKATTPKPIQNIVKKLGKPVMKVWHKYGAIILSVVGGILAPFTGGMSAIAATVLIAAKQMHEAKVNAAKALKAGKRDANVQLAQANAAEVQITAQVEQFYHDNQPWFLQHDITPEAWAKLTLDQKIEIIRAGSAGTLPTGATSTGVTAPVDPSQIPVQGQQGSVATQAAQQAVSTGGSSSSPSSTARASGPAYASPPAYSTGGGGGGGGPSDGAVSTDASGGAAPPPGGAAPAGTYDVIVEGQKVGSAGSLDDASKAALAATSPGDRFEILVDGKSTGLRIRTSVGSVDVPAAQEAQIRSMTHEEVVALEAQAEGKQPAAASGGIPWGVLAAGGVAIAVAMGGGGKKH